MQYLRDYVRRKRSIDQIQQHTWSEMITCVYSSYSHVLPFPGVDGHALLNVYLCLSSVPLCQLMPSVLVRVSCTHFLNILVVCFECFRRHDLCVFAILNLFDSLSKLFSSSIFLLVFLSRRGQGKKGMFLYSAVSSPLGPLKAPTLFLPSLADLFKLSHS